MTDNVNSIMGMPLVSASGALRIARMIPIVEAAGAPFISDLQVVVDIFSIPKVGDIGEVLESLQRWRGELAGSTDVLRREYYQATAVSIGLLTLYPRDPDPGDALARINAIAGNFWNCCDDILNRFGLFQSEAALRAMKTTLRGVEDIWYRRDIELLQGEQAPHEVVMARRTEIEEKSNLRKEIAGLIARYSGW